jgi:CBS domain-containing protein
MQVSELMTSDVCYVTPDTKLSELAQRMRDEDIGSIPVAENDRLIGMVTDRDIVIRALTDGADPRECTARDVMSPKVLYCRASQTVEDVLENMGEQQVRRLPVVDDNKRLVGVISLGDLSHAAEREAGDALRDLSRPVS